MKADRRRDAADVVRPQAGRASVDPRAAGKRSRVDELGREPVHRASTDPAGAGAARPSDGHVSGDAPGELFDRATRGAPEPLPYRREMEAIFGADFSSVRAYPGRSAEMRQLGARGASAGERIAFGPSDPDRELVAHELTHVLQDRRAGGSAAGAALSHPADATEREATAVAAEATQALGSSGEHGSHGGGRLADRISAAPTSTSDHDAASNSNHKSERARNPAADAAPHDESRRSGRADGAERFDASEPIDGDVDTVAAHPARTGTADADDLATTAHAGTVNTSAARARRSGAAGADAVSAEHGAVANTSAAHAAGDRTASNGTTAADVARDGADARTVGTAVTSAGPADAHGASTGAADAAAHVEKADAARSDAANAASATAAKPDAAHLDAAKSTAAKSDATGPDAARLNAAKPGAAKSNATPPASPPHAGAPATGADVMQGGGTTGHSRRSSDGASHALANITPSNLASVVRSVDQSWIADAHAAHATMHAKTVSIGPLAHGAATAAPTAGGPLKRPAESADTAHPAARAGASGSSTTEASAVHGAPAADDATAPERSAAAHTTATGNRAAAAATVPSSVTAPSATATRATARPATHEPPAARAVSAGPRPRVDLSAEASPARIDRKRGTAARVLVDETAGAHVAAATAQPRTQPQPPVPRTPAAPIAAAPVPVEEPRFLASVPPERRPSVEAAVAPVIARRVADVQARVAASQRRTDGSMAELDARHQAEQAHLHATVATRRTQGHAQIDVARQAWQTDTTRVQQTHQRAVDEHHARTQAQVATLVHTGEQQVDTSLTHRETDATGRLATARSQADAMIASAHARAEAARATAASQVKRDANGGDPGDIEASAQVDADLLLAQVMDLIHQMMQAAQTQSTSEVLALRQRITDLLAGSSLTMDQLIDQAMVELPAIAHYYKAQIDQLMASVDSEIAAINVGITLGNTALIEQQMAALAGGLTEKQGMLSDITTLSHYTSVEDLRTAFGIDFDGGAWSESSKEIAVLGAVLTERAFRDSAPAEMFDGVGFGGVFQDVMGPVTMNSTPGGKGAETFWDNDRGHYRIDWYRPVAGNLTEDSDLDIALGLDPDNLDLSLLHNVIHEFGHVFDGRARKHGRIDTDNAERYGQIPSDAAMRAEMTNQQHTNAGAYDYHEEFADLFLNFVTGGFKPDRDGQELKQWFEGNLYGNTADGTIPQDDWGWVDIARDNGPESNWITYGTQFYYSDNVYLDDVASYYGIKKEDIVAANRDKLVPFTGDDGQRHWRLPTGIWITIPGIDRRLQPTAS
jgi:hypothetical protein